MKLQDKIAVMEAALRGEIIEVRGHDGVWRNSRNQPPKFKFARGEYRVKPKCRIEALAKEHGVHDDDLRLLAAMARAVRRDGKDIIELRGMVFGTERLHVTGVSGTGDLTLGCQTFTWDEINKFAKQQGYW